MFRKNQKPIIYLLILLLPFCFLFLKSSLFNSFRFSVVDIASIPIQIFSVPLQEIKKIIFYHRTFDEYKRLKKENDVLKVRLSGLENVFRENARLEQLLQFKRNLVYASIAAKVIGRDPSYWNSSLIIDKGAREGVRQGLSVINTLGVIGKIADVGPYKSKVILLTDPDFSVASIIERSRESGLVSGTLQGLCRMRYLNAMADVRVGDRVVTSNLSSSFPENLLIGEVIRIEETPGKSSTECIIAPSVSISQLEEVLVILK